MGLQVKQRAVSYLEPLIFLLIDLYAAILELFNVVLVKRRPQDLLKTTKFADDAFSRFWLMLAPKLAEREVEMGVPALVASASGTVIEIGPGSGSQVGRYDPAKITKIFGIEPNLGLHDKLRENVKKAGLSDVYTIVPCGVEDVQGLRKHDVDQQAFDTVLSIQVLCCVPDPKETAAALYRLLKPGGKMIVYEHVKSRDFVSSIVQDIYNIVWPHVLANCHLNRDTARTLREAGEWAKDDLERSPFQEDAWQAFPHIWGRLTKAG
ncbi:MAG: hypothetical protein Q9210_007585 [Variospora velana]